MAQQTSRMSPPCGTTSSSDIASILGAILPVESVISNKLTTDTINDVQDFLYFTGVFLKSVADLRETVIMDGGLLLFSPVKECCTSQEYVLESSGLASLTTRTSPRLPPIMYCPPGEIRFLKVIFRYLIAKVARFKQDYSCRSNGAMVLSLGMTSRRSRHPDKHSSRQDTSNIKYHEV